MDFSVFLDNHLILWFLAGFTFIILEFTLPGFVSIIFGFAAWVVAFLLLFFPLSPSYQILLFILATTVGFLFLRKRFQKIFTGIKDRGPSSEVLDEDYIGELVKVIHPINSHIPGTIFYKGSEWKAISEQNISVNEFAEIIDHKSLTFIVKKVEK
jgi:hypothetical protein